MPYILGENVNLGVGGESAAARGTAVAPSIWIPGRTPTGVRPVVQKALLRETTGSGVQSQGSEVVAKHVEGDLEFNVKVNSIGWLFRSLLGSSASVAKSAPNAAVYDHTFSLLTGNPQHPTLTLALSVLGGQDYQYNGVQVSSLELRTPVNDLVNATVGFIGRNETGVSDYTVAFSAGDVAFRQQDISIKIANDISGLGAASPISPKEFSLSINSNARPDMNIGSLTPADVIALLMEIGGSFTLDYGGTTYHDLFVAGTAKAMRIEMTRSDVTIGSSANPKLQIDLPKVTLEDLSPDRPLDDTVKENISFLAHYDTATAKAISVVLSNTLSTYAVA
jgi:hypothetical protein